MARPPTGIVPRRHAGCNRGFGEWAKAADADKSRWAADLLRRAEQLGDAAEAARWRRELDRLGPHTAPPPRPATRP